MLSPMPGSCRIWHVSKFGHVMALESARAPDQVAQLAPVAIEN
jgi:hypothetical protein